MKSKQTFVVFLLTILLLSACKNETEDAVCGCTDRRATNYNAWATCDNSSCVYESTIIFWSSTLSSGSTIIVNIGGKTGMITLRYDGNYLKPTCAGTKLAKFSLPPGTYTYHAQNPSGSKTWDKTITLDTMSWAECVFVNL